MIAPSVRHEGFASSGYRFQRTAYNKNSASSFPMPVSSTPINSAPRARFTVHVEQPSQIFNLQKSPAETFKVPLTRNIQEIYNTGLRILSVPIRRVRGLATALNSLTQFSYVFETVGLMMGPENVSSEPGGITFLLGELVQRQKGVQLKCQYADVDDAQPQLYFGQTYR